MENNKYSFKRNESFYIRDGWFGKAIQTISETSTNIFYKNDGITYLGIGANMVKGLKYWLTAADIIEGKDNHLSLLGKLIYTYDPYLDSQFTWFLIHYQLVKNAIECPIFYSLFNNNSKKFEKEDMASILKDTYSDANPKYVEADFNVFLHSYTTDDLILNPEDNYACPLSQLKLISHEKDKYIKKAPAYKKLTYLLVYYVLQQTYEGSDSFIIEDSMVMKNSPVYVFNLDKYTYLQYLDEMSKNDLIAINKTAGLNTVYFNKKITLEECFKENFDI